MTDVGRFQSFCVPYGATKQRTQNIARHKYLIKNQQANRVVNPQEIRLFSSNKITIINSQMSYSSNPPILHVNVFLT